MVISLESIYNRNYAPPNMRFARIFLFFWWRWNYKCQKPDVDGIMLVRHVANKRQPLESLQCARYFHRILSLHLLLLRYFVTSSQSVSIYFTIITVYCCCCKWQGPCFSLVSLTSHLFRAWILVCLELI